MLPSPRWDGTSRNYVETTRTELQELVEWRGAPPPGGRLLLWQGEPGTGKTSAIRALAGEWRDWAKFHFITDPEQFLANPDYLLEVIGGSRGPAPSRDEGVEGVVLEDSDEYLAPDAKHQSGQALSRLLNVCDGAFGQAMKVLVLVTTNEPLPTLHPPLSRPGRCLAEVGFDRFDRAAIEDWADHAGMDPPDTSAATLADFYAHAEGRGKPRVGRSTLGFAAPFG